MSGKRKTSFRSSMLDGTDVLGDTIRHWAKPVNSDCYSVRCLLCQENINISQRGHAQLVRHPTNQLHQNLRKNNLDNDGKLKKISDTQTDMLLFFKKPDEGEQTWKKRTMKDNVAYAEAIWCACTAVDNLPFRVSNHISDMLPVMFPDSAIAREFQCRQNKASYVISDGLGPLFHNCIENDIRNKSLAYSIQVDEATTAKHWRQFDVIVKYWPEDSKQVLVHHLKSFCMGHANAEQLKTNIMDALSGLYHNKLLQLSSDGPNVMKALQKKAVEDINKDIVDIGTCNIHKTHNAFSAAYDVFESRIETLGLELFYLFKYSAARREDFELAQVKTKVKNHFFLRHVESRWTTLENVVERLEEQLPALRQYFLKDLKDKERESGRVKTICEILTNKVILAEMLFIKSVLTLFSRITRMFQTSAPLIHILYDEMSDLILQLMRRCLKKEAIGDKSGKTLYDIDLEKKDNWLKEVNIGDAAKKELKRLKDTKQISEAVYSSFYRRAKQLYLKAMKELLRTFPLKNSLLKYLQVLHPLSKHSPNSKEAIKQVATRIKAFPDAELDTLCDEWLEYSSEDIPEDWYVDVSKETDNHEMDEDAEEECSGEDSVKYKRIDEYWFQIGSMKRPSGRFKYPTLFKLARIALTLNHGNADIERGFSKNKLILTNNRTRLSMPAINGLRTVASYASKFESHPGKLPYNKDLVSSVLSSHAKYEERKKKDIEIEKKRKMEAEGPDSCKMGELLKKKERSEALLNEGMSMLDEALKLTDRAKSMTKVEAAYAIIQNARQAIDNVQSEISMQEKQNQKKKKT